MQIEEKVELKWHCAWHDPIDPNKPLGEPMTSGICPECYKKALDFRDLNKTSDKEIFG